MSSIKVNCNNIEISNDNKICIIAGPCQLETEQHAMDMAGKLKKLQKNLVLGLFTKLLLIKLTEQVLKGQRGAGTRSFTCQFLIKLKKN